MRFYLCGRFRLIWVHQPELSVSGISRAEQLYGRSIAIGYGAVRAQKNKDKRFARIRKGIYRLALKVKSGLGESRRDANDQQQHKEKEDDSEDAQAAKHGKL